MKHTKPINYTLINNDLMPIIKEIITNDNNFDTFDLFLKKLIKYLEDKDIEANKNLLTILINEDKTKLRVLYETNKILIEYINLIYSIFLNKINTTKLSNTFEQFLELFIGENDELTAIIIKYLKNISNITNNFIIYVLKYYYTYQYYYKIINDQTDLIEIKKITVDFINNINMNNNIQELNMFNSNNASLKSCINYIYKFIYTKDLKINQNKQIIIIDSINIIRSKNVLNILLYITFIYVIDAKLKKQLIEKFHLYFNLFYRIINITNEIKKLHSEYVNLKSIYPIDEKLHSLHLKIIKLELDYLNLKKQTKSLYIIYIFFIIKLFPFLFSLANITNTIFYIITPSGSDYHYYNIDTNEYFSAFNAVNNSNNEFHFIRIPCKFENINCSDLNMNNEADDYGCLYLAKLIEYFKTNSNNIIILTKDHYKWYKYYTLYNNIISFKFNNQLSFKSDIKFKPHLELFDIEMLNEFYELLAKYLIDHLDLVVIKDNYINFITNNIDTTKQNLLQINNFIYSPNEKIPLLIQSNITN